jgi:transposase
MHVMMQTPEADVLTRRQAAARLNVTVNTLNRWAMQGRGPAYSLTGNRKGRALYSAATIAAWLESRKQPPRVCRGDSVNP